MLLSVLLIKVTAPFLPGSSSRAPSCLFRSYVGSCPIMAEQGTSAPMEITTSETPALPEPPSLDDLSPAQAQRVLEAALQNYRAGDESRVVDAGTSAAVPSLMNTGLTTPLTASGEQQRGQISLIYMPAFYCRVTGRIKGLLTRGGAS